MYQAKQVMSKEIACLIATLRIQLKPLQSLLLPMTRGEASISFQDLVIYSLELQLQQQLQQR